MKNKINTIPQALSNAYLKRASKPAMILNNGNKITYNDMMWDVSMTCSILKDNGIKKDSKVALFMDNSPQCVETFFAIVKTGAVVILLNYDYTENQISEILAKENPDLIFVSDYRLDKVYGISNSTILGIDDNRVLKQVSNTVSATISSFAEVNENDNAVVTFTVSENGNIDRHCMTQKNFVNLAFESKNKKNASAVVDSLINGLKSFIAPLFKGDAVKAVV